MLDLGKFTEWLKLPTKTFVALAFACGMLFFASSSFLSVLGLDVFVSSYRPYIGAVFVVTVSLSVVAGVAATLKFFYPWIAEVYWIRSGRKRLRNLNPEEKQLLSHYIDNQTRSQLLPLQSGVVSALVRERIIVRASNLGNYRGFDYNIQPWAWEYLNENPHLLE